MPEARVAIAMHNRTVLLVAALVLVSAGGPAVGLAGAQDVTLTITVVTAAGDPVSNAELTVTWDDGSDTVITRSNGQALVDVTEGADVTIEVDHPGYVRNEPFTIADVGPEEEVEVTVYQKSSVSLGVTDEDGPVEGVRVVLRKNGAVVEVLSTDAAGEVESSVIEAGEYTVNLFEPGYFQQVVALTVQGDTSEEVRIERGSVSVEFLVLDDNFDPPRPVAQASIAGEDFSVVTGSDGRREVSLPVNTEQTVTVEKSGFETIERTVSVGEQSEQVNLSTRKLPTVNVEVSNERVVVGETLLVTVTDQYGEPITTATVYLDGSAVGQPDADGTLRVPIESAGDHAVSASTGELSSEEVTVRGVQPGSEGTGSGSTDDASGSADEPASSLTVGDINLRSTAIGLAGGLVLATVLFLVLRSR
jgi:protocatechuate 3,4-dioxygenase beta subunit